jgi:hypothetical protein
MDKLDWLITSGSIGARRGVGESRECCCCCSAAGGVGRTVEAAGEAGQVAFAVEATEAATEKLESGSDIGVEDDIKPGMMECSSKLRFGSELCVDMNSFVVSPRRGAIERLIRFRLDSLDQ